MAKGKYEPLDEFVQDNIGRPFGSRQHLHFDNLVVFTRLAVHFVGGAMQRTLDLATIDVPEKHQNKKIFSNFLAYAEKVAADNGLALYVESIQNEDLRRFLIKRGYEVTDCPIAPNAFLTNERLKQRLKESDQSPSP